MKVSRSLFVAFAISIACGSAIGQPQPPADAMYTRPGTLISVGTHRLNFYCMGNGSPVVILEGGYGDWSPAFSSVQQRIAAFTRTCSYDRAGFGFSDPGPMPRRIDRLAEELHTALHNGGIPGPYVLVGLAFGSGSVRAFADRWMPEVAGLVLINGDARDVEEPEMHDFWQRLIARQLPQQRLCRDAAAAGKPMTNCYGRIFRGLPEPQFSAELNAVLEDELAKKPATWDTMISELEQIPEDDAYLKEHRTSFGSRPVRIITATVFSDKPGAPTPGALRLEHMRLAYLLALGQSRFLELSSNTKQIFSDTGNLVQFEKPDLVVETIREVWQQAGNPASVQPKDKDMKTATSGHRTRAEMTITVQSSKARPWEETASPPLMEIELRETFAGDIAGESAVRALQIQHNDRSASLVSMQRVRGTVGGRQGTFVLQGQESVENGKIRATWFVVPGSGTGDLSGLRGEGGFEGDFGKGSRGTLDYWFE